MKKRTRKVCAWVSRHPPTAAQREALPGYDIVQLASHTIKADHVRVAIRRQFARCDLVLATLPLRQLARLARIMQPVPVIRADMDYSNPDAPQWRGRYERICGMELVTEIWNPEEG